MRYLTAKVGPGKSLLQTIFVNALVIIFVASVSNVSFAQTKIISDELSYALTGNSQKKHSEQKEEQIDLSSGFLKQDDRFANDDQSELTRDISSQNKSFNIKTVLSSEQMDLFADYSLQDALLRVPGVQADYRKGLNIRGVGYNRYNVTLNGNRLGTTGMGNRNFHLGSISADLVKNVEVIKVITPDMDADALAGNVNIVTHQPDVSDLEIGARLGGGAHPRYFSYTGPESRVTFDYAQALGEDIIISLNLNQQLDNRGLETIALDYGAFEFNDEPVDVYDEVSASMQTSERSRLGGNLQLTYQPSDYTTYYVHGFFNNYNNEENRHRNFWDTGQDWVRPDSTGAQGGQGRHGYDASLQEMTIDQQSVYAGAKHRYDLFDLDVGAGWARSNTDQEKLLFPYELDGVDLFLNLENQNKPTFEITNVPHLRDGTLDRRRFDFQPVDRTINNHVDNTFSGHIDLELPFSPGSLQFGSSAIFTIKDGEFSETNLSYRRLNLFHFEVIKRGAFDPFDHYHIPWLIQPETARHFFQSARPGFDKDEDLERKNSDIWNYQTSEQIYAGYGMVTLETGNITFLGGARIEHTDFNNDGNNVVINENGDHEQTTSHNTGNNYTHLFPHAQLILATGNQSSLRLAYSRSMDRPDFNLLAPFELTNIRDSLLYRGNPQLEPVTSDNLDMIYEHNFGNAGSISVNLFYKQLTGFVFESLNTIQEGEYEGWKESSFINNDETATVYGMEFALQRDLAFLPGFLGNFSTFANYTWSQSEYHVDFREDEVSLPGQSPHVVNAALQYHLRRISGQVAYHWTAKSLSQLEQSTRLAPSINRNQEVSMNRYQDGWMDLSASLRVRITENFRFWADAFHLLNVERVEFEDNRELYPRVTEYRGGPGLRAGIRFIL